jgi:hypothetical protein
VLEAAILIGAPHIHVSIQIHTYICTFSTTNLYVEKFDIMLKGVSAELKKTSLLTWNTVSCATASNKTQWQNIKTTWENSINKPRKQTVAYYWLNTGHDCLAAHLHHIKTFNHNY